MYSCALFSNWMYLYHDKITTEHKPFLHMYLCYQTLLPRMSLLYLFQRFIHPFLFNQFKYFSHNLRFVFLYIQDNQSILYPWFPLFWLTNSADFSNVLFSIFQYFFTVLFLTNIHQFKIKEKIQIVQKTVTFPVFCVKFRDFSSVLKFSFPWLEIPFHFSGFPVDVETWNPSIHLRYYFPNT